VSETIWHLFGIALPMLHLLANFLFHMCAAVSTRSGATAKPLYTSRSFSCMVITSCMNVTVSDFGGQRLLGRNVLCNVLTACYRCFFIYVPNNNHFIYKKVEGVAFRVLGLGILV